MAIVAVSLAGGVTLQAGSAQARVPQTSTRVAVAFAHGSPDPSGRPALRRAGWSAGPVAMWTGYHSRDGSDRVREVQRTLRRVGYAPGPVDGLFGPLTERAVLRFQRAQGLRADAIVGPRTLHALRSLAARDRTPDSKTRSPDRPLPTPPAHPAPAPREAPIADSVPAADGSSPRILLWLGFLLVLIGGAAVVAPVKLRRGREAPSSQALTPSTGGARASGSNQPIWAATADLGSASSHESRPP